MKKIQTEGIKAMEVKQEVVDEIYAHFDEFHSKTVWGEPCNSWFKDGKNKARIYLWPGSVSLCFPSSSHFIYNIDLCQFCVFSFNFTNLLLNHQRMHLNIYLTVSLLLLLLPLLLLTSHSLQTIHFLKTLKDPRYEDYNYRYNYKNRFAFLGNGDVKHTASKNVVGLAPYIRSADTEWCVD